jgi:hypothetical protein
VLEQTKHQVAEVVMAELGAVVVAKAATQAAELHITQAVMVASGLFI